MLKIKSIYRNIPSVCLLNSNTNIRAKTTTSDVDTEVMCILPVSYTHLDVYKRQGYGANNSPLILNASWVNYPPSPATMAAPERDYWTSLCEIPTP